MKVIVLVLTAGVVGLGLGLGTTWYERSLAREQFLPVNKVIEKVPVDRSDPTKFAKAVVVGGTIYDFGTMERSGELTHDFEFKNVGNLPLVMELGRTTCICTVSELVDNKIPPGGSAMVTLSWNVQAQGISPEYSQTAEIHTNDPEQQIIQLKIIGLVTESITTLPAKVTVGSVSSNDDFTTTFRIHNFRTDRLNVISHEMGDAETADHFEVSFEPLSPEEIATEPGAKSGVKADLTVKSGLPLGPINQTIRLVTDLDQSSLLIVPVHGSIVSDIMLSGSRDFDREQSLVDFGIVPADEGAERSIRLYVKGPLREEVTLKVGRIEPAGYLELEIGPPDVLEKVVKYDLTIRVAAGKETIYRMGSANTPHGRIDIETSHPQATLVPIYVKFAVDR